MARSIAEVLSLIEEYIEVLHEWELSHAYVTHARSFESWLLNYGCSQEQRIQADLIIQEATGLPLAAIATIDDVETVKTALYGLCNSEALGRRRSPDELLDPGNWAIANVRFGFGLDGDDPAEESW